MRWLKLVSPADIFTLMNGVIGFVAITCILEERFILGSFLILVAMIMDALDGAVARAFGSKHSFGRYLDSISDAISFCFAPALLLYVTYYEKGKPAFSSLTNALTLLTALFVLLFGILRLARFSWKDYKREYFLGVPTPALTFLVIVLCLLFGRATFSFSMQPYLVLPLVLAVSFLMITDLPYPKLRPRFNFIGSSMVSLGMFAAVLYLTFMIDFNLFCIFLKALSLLGTVLIASYLLLGPFIVLLRKRVCV